MQSRLLARTRAVNIWLMAPLLGLAVFLSVFVAASAPVAQAAASSNLNFQARLLTSSGAIVPDGTYNIDFKLYTADSTTGSVGTCTGACVWEETRKNFNSQGVQTINGYFSVNLGSVTAFSSTINWDQQLWLTMNIGGTSAGASPTWDGEMQNAGHSILLTALPYAFAANKLTSGTGSGRGTLSFASLGQATDVTLPDPGASTATICYQGSSACNFINNSTGGPQTANFNIQSAASGSIGAIINGASGQSADLFELKNSSVVLSVGNNGQTLFKPTSGNDSTTFFQIQPAASSTPVFDVDTNGGVGINKTPASGIALDVNGTIATNNDVQAGIRVLLNNTAVNSGRIDKAVVAGSTGFNANDVVILALESGNIRAIQTTTARDTKVYGVATSTKATGATGSATISGDTTINVDSGAVAVGDQLVTSTSAGLATVDNNATTGIIGIALSSKSAGSSGTVSIAVRPVGGQYTPIFKPLSDSSTAFQVQSSGSSTPILDVDTSGGRVGVGGTPTTSALEVLNGTNANAQIRVGSLNQGGRIDFVRGSDGSSSLNGVIGWDTATTGSTFSVVNGSGSGVIVLRTSSTSSAGVQVQTNSGTGTATRLTIDGAGTALFKSDTSATALQVQNASSIAVAAVDTSGNQVVLGTAGTSGLNGKLVFNTINAGNTNITIQAASTGTSYSLTLPTTGPALGQCLQNDGSTIGQLTFGACGASGTFLNKNSTDTSSAAGGSGYLYGFTSTGTSTGGVLSLNNSTNTGNTLNATTAGNPAANKAVIYAENTNASPTGNLIDLRSGSTPTSKFSVDASGNVSFGGTLNTNTFTSTSLAFAGAGSASIQSASSQALNITGNATSLWQVGGTNQNLTIQTSGTGTLALDSVGLGTVNLGATNAGTINIGNANSTSISIGSTSLVGTITHKVQGLTTTQTGAASNSSFVVKSTSNSTGTFQVQNSSGNKVLNVDTSAGQTILGQSNSLNGSLVFQNSSGSNAVTLNSTSTSANYTLTLPTGAPAGGLCIETSTGNASQLIFASCSNNNASIQQVNYWDANNTNSVTVSPTTIGDEMILTTQIPTGGVTVTNVTGGGVTTWNKVIANAGNGTVNRVELWVGTVTSTGSSSVTVTYSSSPGAEEVTVSEFTAAGVNSSTSWGIESSNSQLNSSASTTVTFPSATAVNGSELYYGYGQVQSPPATAGSTSGFSYQVTSTQHNIISYNTSLSANATYQPTATQNSSGQSNTVEVVLTAFVTSTSINNTTSLQKANFYVQAASSGTVAGVLQAASTGSADIFDVRNSGGTNTLTVGSTGDVLIKPAASTTAFQVQNGSGYSVLGVDTSGGQVTVGDATHLSGKITFRDSGDSNTISIQAPTSVAASYTLSLPTNTPTAGLCLGTSPSNANQLIFASCATQVSAASITYINQWSNSGTSITTLADSPATIGNLLVLFSHVTNAVTISSISGGGVTNWTKVTGNTGGAGFGNDEMWRGVVTATGSATITVTYSAAGGANEITAQEYTMGGTGGGTWAIDTSGALTGTSTTVNYPSLTPANSSELYAGYAWGANTMSAGSTSGYTYVATNSSKYTARNTSVSGGVATQPTASQNTSGAYNSIAAVIQAFAGTSVIVNSTATQQANFNVQAPISGTVAGVLQGASSGTADVLQVKDGSGLNVMTVNTSNINGVDGVTLGAAGSVGGQLTFNSSGNSNSITIAAPSAPGSSYTLTLPTTTPAAGQCLATSPSNANQLVFSSCANQVTSVAISFVSNWKGTSSATPATLSVSPTNVGDLLVLFVSFNKADTVNSGGVSGGGCGTAWSKVAATSSGSGTDLTSIEMYRCQVVTTGSSTISVTWSGPAGTHELAASEFTTGSTTGSWVVDSSNTQFNSSSTTTATWPSLTPQSTKDLYVGYGAAGAAFSGAVSSGYTYLAGSLTNRAGLYNTSVSATSQPTATITSSASLTVGALIAAYSSSSVISNSTVTQQGNFNIQAATSGSVAGVLQAFAAGTGDIMDLLDGSGTLVGSVGYSGNMLVRPSTASASAFQVQTTGSVNVLAVDTSGKQVVVGAGSTGESSVSLLVLDNRTGSSADPTGVNGAMYYNATTHLFRCYVAGAWQNCSGLLSSNTSQSSANNNCSNNCAAFSTFASIPANYCQAGRVIRLNAHGYFSSLGSAGNLQFGVYYGTDGSVAANDTLLGTLTPAVSVTSASNNYFGLDFDVTCFSTTSMQADGLANIQVGAAASGVTGVPISSTSPTTVVSTSAKNLYIFPVWGTASTSNTAKITQFIVGSP